MTSGLWRGLQLLLAGTAVVVVFLLGMAVQSSRTTYRDVLVPRSVYLYLLTVNGTFPDCDRVPGAINVFLQANGVDNAADRLVDATWTTVTCKD